MPPGLAAGHLANTTIATSAAAAAVAATRARSRRRWALHIPWPAVPALELCCAACWLLFHSMLVTMCGRSHGHPLSSNGHLVSDGWHAAMHAVVVGEGAWWRPLLPRSCFHCYRLKCHQRTSPWCMGYALLSHMQWPKGGCCGCTQQCGAPCRHQLYGIQGTITTTGGSQLVSVSHEAAPVSCSNCCGWSPPGCMSAGLHPSADGCQVVNHTWSSRWHTHVVRVMFCCFVTTFR